MAWVKLDDHFPDHPKIVSAGPLGAWLYVAGLCYCNRLLTNGFIPVSQVARLSPHREDQDIRDGPDRLAQRLCALGLWVEAERKGVSGFVVHDFLKYQPSKRQVMTERAKTAIRQGRFRNGHRNAASNGVSNGGGNAAPDPVPDPVPQREKTSPSLVSRNVLSSAPARDVAERAGRLIERYAQLYSKHRNGAKLRLIGNSLEFQDACSLCETWDDQRLEKLAAIVLTSDDEFIAKTDRSFKIFALKASWADDRLTAWEAEQQVQA